MNTSPQQLPTGTARSWRSSPSGAGPRRCPPFRSASTSALRIDVELEVGADDRVGRRSRRTTPLVQTSSLGAGHDRQRRADPGAAAQRPQLRQPDARPSPASCAASLAPTSTAPAASPGAPRRRSRPTASAPRDNNYMLDGVDNNETWLADGRDLPERRRARRVQAADQHLLGRVRPVARAASSTCRSSRARNQYHGSGFEFLRNDAFDANNFFNNRSRSRRSRTSSQNQFGGTARRPHLQGQDVLLRRLPGPPRATQGQTFLSTVPVGEDAGGRLLGADARHLRPADRAAVPGNVIPSEPHRSTWRASILDQLYPAPNTAGTRNAATGQTINNYLINPIKERQDNQFDVKVDHNLTPNNRFFARYSYEKTHRLQPATLPHGDAGVDLRRRRRQHQGAGPGLQRHAHAQQQLAERVPVRLVADQVLHDADRLPAPTRRKAVGIPGHQPQRRRRPAMTQLIFQNIRNLGAERQPAAHHEPERLPALRQRHVDQGQAHAQGRRQHHASVARDPQRRHHRRQLRVQQQHDRRTAPVSTAGCKVDSNTGFDVASFLLGLASAKNRAPLRLTSRRSPPYMETPAGVCRSTSQDDWRVNEQADAEPRPAVGHVSALDREDDDRQSNFDETTGQFVVASDDADASAASTSAATCRRYSEGRLRPAARLRLRPRRRRQDAHPRRLRRVLELQLRAAPRRRRRRTSRSCSRPQLTPTPSRVTAAICRWRLDCPDPDAVDPTKLAAGWHHAFRLRRQFPRRARYNYNLNVQRGLGTNYLVEVAYVGSRGRQMVLKVDINQAPPVVGVSDANVNRPYITLAPLVRSISQSQEHRDARLQRVPAQVPAAVREQLLVPELLHHRPFRGLRVRQRGRHREHLRHRLQPRVV